MQLILSSKLISEMWTWKDIFKRQQVVEETRGTGVAPSLALAASFSSHLYRRNMYVIVSNADALHVQL